MGSQSPSGPQTTHFKLKPSLSILLLDKEKEKEGKRQRSFRKNFRRSNKEKERTPFSL